MFKILQKDTSSGYPAHIYLFEINNKNNRIKFEICSNLTIKTPERRHSGVE